MLEYTNTDKTNTEFKTKITKSHNRFRPVDSSVDAKPVKLNYAPQRTT
jgi:hypothetical protein